TQILAAGTIGERDSLPSALYIPHPDEFAAGTLQLPWQSGERHGFTGIFARDHGALVPDRLVTSAKSWLCQAHADRKGPILPWQPDLPAGKISPFEAARRYLEHLRESFLTSRENLPPLDDCETVITVPASFDEAARALTHEAAIAAG